MRINSHKRSAALLFELIVVMAILMLMATFVTALCLQVRNVWRDVAHQRIALNELTNQLEMIRDGTLTDLPARLNELTVSQNCKNSLPFAQISGTAASSELGIRVDLSIDWKRRYPAPPVKLSGWIVRPTGDINSSDDSGDREVENE